RFCLNHYVAGPIEVRTERDPYNAMEYLRLRPEVYGQTIVEFVEKNFNWIQQFFPNAELPRADKQKQSAVQRFLEILFGWQWLNRLQGKYQLMRIHRGIPAVANDT